MESPLPFQDRIPAPLAWIPPALTPKECPFKAPCSSQESKELQRSLQEAGKAGRRAHDKPGFLPGGRGPHSHAGPGSHKQAPTGPRTGMGTPRRATQQLPTPRTVAQLTHTTRPVAEQPFIKSHTIKLGLCSQDPPRRASARRSSLSKDAGTLEGGEQGRPCTAYPPAAAPGHTLRSPEQGPHGSLWPGLTTGLCDSGGQPLT